MANVIGVDTALLAKVNLATEAAWPANMADIENKDIQATTLMTLIAKQKKLGAEFVTKLTDPDKVHDVKVRWADFCGIEASDVDSDVCEDLTGTMVEVKEKSYSIATAVETGYAIEENKLKDSRIDKEQLIGEQHEAAIKRLLEKLNLKGGTFLNANFGYNAGTEVGAGYPFTAGTFVSEVPAADYNMELMNAFMMDAMVNRIPDSFIIDGGKLYRSYTTALQNIANGEGKGDAVRAKLIESNFDILGFAGLGISDTTFVIAPGSYAFVNKNYIPNRAPVYDEAAGKWKYSFPIPALGIVIDAFMQRFCVNASKNLYTIKWLYKVHYGFLLNPEGCDQGGGNITTGILKYKKLAAV